MENIKDIPDYEGRYAITTDGMVWSHVGKAGWLKLNSHKGYNRVTLRNNNKPRIYFVHRLVAYTFMCNPHNKPEINHINGIKNDNRVENLEWCTSRENQLHAVATGLQKPQFGIANGMYGKNHTRETKILYSKQKSGKNNPRARKVTNGIICFYCAKDASNFIGLNKQAVQTAIYSNTRAGGTYWSFI